MSRKEKRERGAEALHPPAHQHEGGQRLQPGDLRWGRPGVFHDPAHQPVGAVRFQRRGQGVCPDECAERRGGDRDAVLKQQGELRGEQKFFAEAGGGGEEPGGPQAPGT